MKNAGGWNLPQGILHFRSLGLWTFLVLEDGIMWDLYGFVGFPFLCTLCMFYCNVAGWVVHRKCKLVVLRSCLPWKMQGVGTSPKGSYIFGPLVFEHFWCWKMGLCGICMDLWGFHSFALCACFTAMLLGGWCIENVSWWSWGPVFHEKCRGLEPPPRDLTFSVPWSLNIFGVGRWDYVGFVWICGVSIPLHFVHVLLQCCWVGGA